MGFLKKLFRTRAPKTGIVFIVEDNTIYAKTIEASIKSSVPQVKEVRIFPVGETALLDLHLNPDLIIMDYFLDTKYYDAETGLEAIKKIRAQKSEANIVILSSQDDIEVAVDAIKNYDCSYIKKDVQAFDRLEELLKDIYTVS